MEKEEVDQTDLELVIEAPNVVEKPKDKAAIPEHNQVTISWHEISFAVSQKNNPTKIIIQEGFGYAKPGEVLAIMGGSGAGKSTMLDLIRGRIQPTAGQILFNGQSRPKSFKHISSYVQQEDALYPILTVRETIAYAARLQLPKNLSAVEISAKVEEVIQVMGLARCANTRIGNVLFRGISGGEKRRVSIAVELVTDPDVIMLDEPTSGLDSEAARQVVQLLRKLAVEKQKTVVATIHQPSSDIFAMFDKLLLLSGGRVMFHGSARESLSYFETVLFKPCPQHYNPPDHYLSVLNPDFQGDQDKAKAELIRMADAFKKSPAGKLVQDDLAQIVTNPENIAIIEGNFAASTFKQIAILTERSYKNAYRNILVYWIRAAMFVGMAILMGTTFYDIGTRQSQIQDRFSAHFFAVAFLCFMSVASIPGIIEEKSVFDREVLNGVHNVEAYVVANTLTSIPFILFIACIFTVIAYPLIMFQSGANNILNYIMLLFLALYTMESIIVCISSLIPIFVVGLALGAFLNGLFMCVQGYFVRYSELPKFWIWAHYWSYQTYAFEALIKSDFNGIVFDCGPGIGMGPTGKECFCQYISSINNQCKMSGLDVIRSFGYADVSIRNWVLILLLQIAVYRIIMFAILKLKTREK